MIYVFENDNNDASIVYDGTILTEAERTKGIAIEQLPHKEEIEGKIAVLKCNKATGEVWYEYIDKPIDEDKKIQELEQKIQAQEVALAELTVLLSMIMGGVN